MKRFTTIMCAMTLMTIGLWRSWEDSHTKFDSYKTVAASTLPQNELFVPSFAQNINNNNNAEVATSVEVPVIEYELEPVVITAAKTKTEKSKKRKVSRQKHIAKEARAIKVSCDSTTYYEKRILEVVEHIDKKISAPCVELVTVDSLSNGSH